MSLATNIWKLKDINVKLNLSLVIMRITKLHLNSKYECKLCCIELFKILKGSSSENLLNNKLDLYCMSKVNHTFKYFRD